jgi:hypothetical protein
MRGPIEMAKVTKDLTKISWTNWDEKDILVVQACEYDVDEEDAGDPEDAKKTIEDAKKTIKVLTRVRMRGSVKFTFRRVNTRGKVNKHIKDIEDGKLK